MDKLRQKVDELSSQFRQKKAEDYKSILNELFNMSNIADITHVEKIVILINQCIMLDALNIDNIEIEKKILTKNKIVEEIKILYEEFIFNSIIDEWEKDALISFKEQISYSIALILYKVHDYANAYNYFLESKKFSDRLNNKDNLNGLDLLQRIKRDIHFAYCCEYIGTPKMDCSKLVMSLKLLLGEKEIKEDVNGAKFWNEFKDYMFTNLDQLENIISSKRSIEAKTLNIIKFLIGFFDAKNGVFSRLIKMQDDGEKNESEYKEAIHALAHCLNELNLFFVQSDEQNVEIRQTNENAMESLKKKNIVKLIVRICIDSLGNKYGTCQATIRAEQGNGLDAILRMHNMDKTGLKPDDLAELDFYQFYFESMFPYYKHNQEHGNSSDSDKGHVHGKFFYNFCIKNKGWESEDYQDGLLHYYVVLLKNQIKNYLEKFMNSENKNELFFDESYKISNMECFISYEELRTHEFSQFVNTQMVFERKKLITIYKILSNLQNSKIPLFFEPENFEKNLKITDKMEELYDLCKKFNKYAEGNMDLLKSNTRNCLFCDKLIRNQNHGKKNMQDVSEIYNDNADSTGIPIFVDGLIFKFYGDIDKLKEYFEKYSFENYRIMEKNDYDARKAELAYKILYFENTDECYKYCQNISGIDSSGTHIFYVGEQNTDFAYKTIAGFESINLCFMMAYIYESIENIINDIFKPKPIYILAPLRNVSNYEFQEAEFDSLLCFPQNYIHPIEVGSVGIGIKYQNEKEEEECFKVKFCNEKIKAACVAFIKLHEDRLFVLRNDKLVRKNVHIGLVKEMYKQFANARKICDPKRHVQCSGEVTRISKCSYFYSQLSNETCFSKKMQKALQKLWYLLHIACEEQVDSLVNCYFLQESFVKSIWLNGGDIEEFQIWIFNKDIKPYLGEGVCFKEIVNIEKGYFISENNNVKVDYSKENDEKQEVVSQTSEIVENENVKMNSEVEDNKQELIEKLKNFIEECKDYAVEYHRKEYNSSLTLVEKIKNKAQSLQECIQKNEKDITEATKAFYKLKDDLYDVRE